MLPENNTDVQFLEEHLQRKPNSILFARLADARLNEDRVEEAIQLCEQGLKKHPYYVTGHLILGKCYLAKKLYDQAEKEFKRVLLFDPKYLAAHKYYGDLMREIGWENTCEMSYKKILQIDPLDEVAQSIAGEYTIESEPTNEELEDLEAELTDSGMEVEGVAPITQYPEDEDLLFQEEGKLAPETIPQRDKQKSEIDDKKAEEFSYILEDIFKDEIADEDIKTHEKTTSPESGEEEMKKEIERETDSYLAGLKLTEQETGKVDVESESETPKSNESGMDQEINKTGKHNHSYYTTYEVEKKPLGEPSKPKKTTGEKIVTPTLGEIYAAQGQYAKAIGVFEMLLKKHPENETYLQKIEYLKQKVAKSKNASKN